VDDETEKGEDPRILQGAGSEVHARQKRQELEESWQSKRKRREKWYGRREGLMLSSASAPIAWASNAPCLPSAYDYTRN
jgi:hypothetical protein